MTAARKEGGLKPVREWRIHFGAHKTATTHAQLMLEQIRPQLVARGVDFIPSRIVRQSGLARTLTKRRLASRLPVLRRRFVERVMREMLDPVREGPETLVVSEEKLIGNSRNAYSQPFYPMIETIVPLLSSLRRADLTFFLSIRSFDAQLPSAYAQELKYMPPPEGGFDAIKQRILADPPSWSELVRRIRRAAPGVRLKVWRQEDYRAHTEEILTAFCGLPVGPLPAIPDPPWTRTPSLEAIRAADALPRDLSRDERRVRVLEIYEEAREGTPFRPFTSDESWELRAAYEADLARIDALDPGILLRFEA